MGGVSNLSLKLRQFLPHAAPVGLRRVFVPLTAEGPGLRQGPGPLCFPSGLVCLLCGLRAERGPLQALVQLLFQLLEGQRDPGQGYCRNWVRNLRSCLCLQM